MKTDSFNFDRRAEEIFVYKWLPENEKKLKGIIQISHGMSEHAGRYEDFAKKLTNSNFLVYGNDHRGHGRTAESEENLGHFSDEYGWELVVQDMHTLTSLIREEYPSLPLFLFGHSLGSLLARDYIGRFGDEIEGAILSGTSGDPGFMGTLGSWIAKFEIMIGDVRNKSDMLNNLLFDDYNKNFEPNRTDFDWLSRNEEEVNKYIEDPYCGQVPSAGFFRDLFKGVQKVNSQDVVKNTPTDLPIFLISGGKDPVGGNGKGIIEVYNSYKQAGVEDIECKLYPNSRHEILNEINKEEVYKDITQWLNNHC